MTFLTATRYGADAAVVYHVGDTEKYLAEVNGLDAPLLTMNSGKQLLQQPKVPRAQMQGLRQYGHA